MKKKKTHIYINIRFRLIVGKRSLEYFVDWFQLNKYK
jgi:hypothetical protein